MTKSDYESFLYKIDQLNKLIIFVNESTENYNLIINCNTHQEVVELADRWGFKIGKRWGEK